MCLRASLERAAVSAFWRNVAGIMISVMGRIYYKESVVLAIFTWMENERVVLMNVDAESRVVFRRSPRVKITG
jgi:hypothetical protein